MRRVIAISLAILVFAVGARGVMAQESEQQVSDRLLEILKDRAIISEDEYSELKDLAVQMEADRGEMDSRLDEIDRSITEYLAQSGDARGANVSHKKGKGFGSQPATASSPSGSAACSRPGTQVRTTTRTPRSAGTRTASPSGRTGSSSQVTPSTRT